MPFETITPQRFASSELLSATRSGSLSTSTEKTTPGSSALYLGGNRGSLVDDDIAFSMISKSSEA
jgi:hypothetical protein